MCGIAGVLSLTDRPPDPAWGATLVRALSHRGPDGDGVYADERVVLAHTRLAIIDPSEAGRQPMAAADGRHVIVLNGEIYNHEALRPALERDGVRFRSRSDTEALVESVARRGAAAVPDLLGMFAFACYDRGSGDLLLARDRLGKRPLFTVSADGWFAFASEVRALLALPFVRPRLDRASVRDYVRHLYVPTPHTMFEGVEKLPPGATRSVRGGPGGAPRAVARYWMPPAPDPRAERRPDRAFFDALDATLLDATRLRTVSDVPIGVFLSGGIDSNVVISSLARAGHRPIRAFTVGFDGIDDERPLARLGAKRYADEHVELRIASDVAREVPEIVRSFGEPLGDSGIVTSYLISREASRHVKVVLNGDGGDELFGGYPRYPFARRVDVAGELPLGRAAARAAYLGRRHMDAVFAALARGETAAAARVLGSVTRPTDEMALLAPEIVRDARPNAETRLPEPDREAGLLGALFAWDTAVYLPDDLLFKVDHASMAHALENRSPFLDHRLFELVATVAPSRRADLRRTKPLLRRLARGRIPSEILAARKRGFQLPVETWLRGPLRGWLDGLVRRPEATARLYRPGALASELDAFQAGYADPLAPYRLWSLATLELWARTYRVEVPS